MPALFLFGVILEVEAEESALLVPVPLTALLAAGSEVLPDALLVATAEAGSAASSTTATDWVEVGAVETAELEATELMGSAAGGR